LSIQVVAGMGGLVLVVGVVMLGLSRLDHGTWGTLGDRPARVTVLGIAIVVGSAVLNALHRERR
jgi:drug/metabolite transporter (DMT)-like permease